MIKIKHVMLLCVRYLKVSICCKAASLIDKELNFFEWLAQDDLCCLLKMTVQGDWQVLVGSS